MYIFFSVFIGALTGLFTQINHGDESVRAKAIHFLGGKLKHVSEEVFNKEFEDSLIAECKKVCTFCCAKHMHKMQPKVTSRSDHKFHLRLIHACLPEVG